VRRRDYQDHRQCHNQSVFQADSPLQYAEFPVLSDADSARSPGSLRVAARCLPVSMEDHAESYRKQSFEHPPNSLVYNGIVD
jgi:hypothetical protein